MFLHQLIPSIDGSTFLASSNFILESQQVDILFEIECKLDL